MKIILLFACRDSPLPEISFAIIIIIIIIFTHVMNFSNNM